MCLATVARQGATVKGETACAGSTSARDEYGCLHVTAIADACVANGDANGLADGPC